MASPSLYRVFADIGGQLSGLFGSPVAWDWGAEARWANASPPQVIFVVTSETFGPVDVSSYYPAKDAATPRTQRAIATRSAVVEAHLWAAAAAQPPATSHDDHDATEKLLNAVMFAAWTTARGTLRFSAGRWLALEGDGGMHLGLGYVLTFDFSVPVIEPVAPTTVVITAIPQTNQASFADGQNVQSP